ncbi:MAG: hypothetical protein ACRDNF_00665 [Streptosporangiaceae bacterium]
MLGVVFLVIHVVTAVADSYVSIRLAAAIIPFTSSYEPLPIGLGAIALDLIAALVLTSLLRARIGRRLWRGVHWLAYAAFPVAVLHSVTSAKDLRSGVLLGLTAACVLSVAAAVGYRLVPAPATACAPNCCRNGSPSTNGATRSFRASPSPRPSKLMPAAPSPTARPWPYCSTAPADPHKTLRHRLRHKSHPRLSMMS